MCGVVDTDRGPRCEGVKRSQADMNAANSWNAGNSHVVFSRCDGPADVDPIIGSEV